MSSVMMTSCDCEKCESLDTDGEFGVSSVMMMGCDCV